jgi:hypothetical protein
MFTPIILLSSSVRVFAPAVFSRLCLWLPNITDSRPCYKTCNRKLRTQICCMILGWNLGQIVIYSSTPTPSRAVEFSGEKSQQLVNTIHGEGDGDGPILCECTHKVMTGLICVMFDLVYSRTDSILTSKLLLWSFLCNLIHVCFHTGFLSGSCLWASSPGRQNIWKIRMIDTSPWMVFFTYRYQ